MDSWVGVTGCGIPMWMGVFEFELPHSAGQDAGSTALKMAAAKVDTYTVGEGARRAVEGTGSFSSSLITDD